MTGRTLLVLTAALLLVAPLAQAAPKPVAYFLKDGDDALSPPDPGLPPLPVPLPIGVPQLVVSGSAVMDPYDPLLGNIPNSTQPKLRLVTAVGDALAPLQYLTPENHSHPQRLRGYLLVGLWPGQSAILNGNLTGTLYEVPPEGADPIALANASLALDLNQSKLPNATSLLPPNSTDPLVIVYYELGQVLPLVLTPPAYFLIGPVDLNLTSNTSRLALGISLTQGSSPVPLPIGAAASLQYDSIYSPSFVLVPWYAPDPVRTTPTRSVTTSQTVSRPPVATTSGTITLPDDAYGDDGKDTPGVGFLVLAAALVAAAVAARRRIK